MHTCCVPLMLLSLVLTSTVCHVDAVDAQTTWTHIQPSNVDEYLYVAKQFCKGNSWGLVLGCKNINAGDRLSPRIPRGNNFRL